MYKISEGQKIRHRDRGPIIKKIFVPFKVHHISVENNTLESGSKTTSKVYFIFAIFAIIATLVIKNSANDNLVKNSEILMEQVVK